MVEDTDSRVILMLEMDALPDTGVVNGLREAVAVSGVVAEAGRHSRLLWGEGYSTIIVKGRTFRISPDSFFQANAGLLPILLQQTLSAVKADEIDTGVELYAGVGLFSILLSERVRRLVAVEWNRDAVEDAGVNLHTNQVKNVEVIAKSAEDALDLLLSRDAKPGLVVMDPPREGLSNAVRHKILQMSPDQLIYISCNPATLARDIKSLLASGEYVLEKVQPLDMFPHTSHIECICSLARKRSGTRMAQGGQDFRGNSDIRTGCVT
jgi:23S rRNA (uracil1939-C5)-methyltransferase